MSLKVSIVIPHREGEVINETLASVYMSHYDKHLIEIFQAEGTHPTAQRNACIKEASGDIIYFIDNDSIINPNNIDIAVKLFEEDDNIAIVGGPAIHIINSNIEKYIDGCLCSFFAVGPLASRYSKQSKTARDGTDRDVILCNLFIRHTALLEAGLFNEALYPNEENALIDKIRYIGYRLIYHPEIIVKRPPRSSLQAYIKMLLNYGRGRFEQMLREFNIKNIVFVLPMLFALYIVLIPILALYYVYVQNIYVLLYLVPLAIYLLATAIAAALTAYRAKSFLQKVSSFFIYFAMFFITHFFYGFGFFYGIARALLGIKRVARFTVNKHKSFN